MSPEPGVRLENDCSRPLRSSGTRVEAVGVTKRFGELSVLDDLSLDISRGEVFGLIGPNGAGKTTFLRILTGFWLPTEGDVRVEGISVVRDPVGVQSLLGYAPEQPKLYSDHRVDVFLRMMAALRGLSGPRLRAAVEASVERFGLQPVRRRRIGLLSKGFRQRVSLAQALIHDPPLVVIDEPTVGLDPRQQIELRSLIQSLGGRHTIVICTHQLREAEALCDRVALLDQGRLRAIATAAEIRADGSLEKLFLARTALGAGE